MRFEKLTCRALGMHLLTPSLISLAWACDISPCMTSVGWLKVFSMSHVVGGDGEGALALDPNNIEALTRAKITIYAQTCQKWWIYFYIFSVAYIAYVVPVQARWIQIIVSRDLAARLSRRQPSSISARLMCWQVPHFLAILPNFLRYRSTSQIEPGVFAPGSLPRRGTHKYPNVTLPTCRALLVWEAVG